MLERVALDAEGGVPVDNPTPRQVIPVPPEPLNPTHSMGTGNLCCTATPSVPVGVNSITGTAIFIATPPTLSTSLYRPYRRLLQSLLHRPSSEPACIGSIDGYRNIYCTAPLSAPARTGPINEFCNTYSIRESLYQAYQRVRQPLLRRPTPSTDLKQRQ